MGLATQNVGAREYRCSLNAHRRTFPTRNHSRPKGRATRERILQSAAEGVILVDGISGLNLKKVREAASVSGSQLTHYFRR